MATAMRRVRRRRPAAAPPAGDSDNYRRSRAAIALMLFIVFFGWLWLFNGEMTAQFTARQFRVDLVTGWGLHFAVSALELAGVLVVPFLAGAPRAVGAVLLALSLPLAIYDVLSSAVGVGPYLLFTGVAAPAAYGQNTLAALAIAFLPERMLYWLCVALRNVLRS